MLITRVSEISGIERSLELPITQEQIDAHSNGEYIQVAFSNLTPDEREFYMTGITPEEWHVAFPEDDDEEDYDTTARGEGQPY